MPGWNEKENLLLFFYILFPFRMIRRRFPLPRYPILLFDADGTLFDFEKAEENALYQAFRTVGFSCTPDIYHRYHEINRGLWLQLEQGLITRERLKTERFSLLF